MMLAFGVFQQPLQLANAKWGRLQPANARLRAQVSAAHAIEKVLRVGVGAVTALEHAISALVW
ncbi:MAG: hypothetical protein ABSH42_10735 [Bryobacteraceae bacterium]|jgi:hypothetical protein